MAKSQRKSLSPKGYSLFLFYSGFFEIAAYFLG